MVKKANPQQTVLNLAGEFAGVPNIGSLVVRPHLQKNIVKKPLDSAFDLLVISLLFLGSRIVLT